MSFMIMMIISTIMFKCTSIVRYLSLKLTHRSRENMNKMNMKLSILAILAILSITTLNAYALAVNIDTNISTNETIANPVSTTDTIEINETANFINITENSNETTVIESIIKEEQKKSPGFGLTDSVISLITVIILMMGIVYIRNNW